jgi:hypothetical protein
MIIKPKRKFTAGAPTTSDIAEGEIAINTADKKLYVRDNANNIVEIGGGGSASGATTDVTQSSHGFAVKDCIRHTGSAWTKARANSNSTLALGVVTAVADSNTFTVAQSGRFELTSHGLTVGQWYYLSESSAGALTTTEPAISQPLVYVESANFLFVFPYRPTNLLVAGQVPLGIHVDEFTGNGSTAAYTLGADPLSEDNTQVYINGVYQEKSTYAVSGTTLTFDTNITNGSSIEVVRYAANTVTIGTPDDNTVTTAKIADDAVTTAKIADNAITSAKIGVDVIVAADLAANSITVSEIQDDAVTTAKIADDAITSALIADDAVVTAAIADDAITTALIADDAVTSALIADNTITVGNMAAGTIKTPGSNNLAIGLTSLVDGSLSGQWNVGVGTDTLKENEGGLYNTAVGMKVLPAQTSASYNTAVGYGAGFTITTGGYNCLFGFGAAQNLTIGTSNNFLGMYAGYTATEASYSTGIGYQPLYDLTTGNHNVAIGLQSQYDTNTGHSNTTVGNYSMYGNTTGYLNTACGYASMYSSAGHTGTYNAALGAQAGYSVTTGYNNTFCGGLAGYALTEGHHNTLIGVNAGYGLLTGDNNTCLGGNAGRAASPSGNITSGNNIICLGDNSIANLYCADTSISSSDERDKAEITNFTHGLSWVKKMRPVTYKWDKRSWYLGEDEEDITKVTRDGSKKKSKVNIGLIAQEVLEIEKADSFSSSKDNMLVVNLNEDDTGYGIKYERIVPILINAIKELETRLAAVEAS